MKVLNIILCILLLAGCGTKQKKYSVSQQAAVIQRWQTDSLAWQQLNIKKGQRNVTIRVVRLAKPDSLGRQPVESVSEIQIEETNNQKDSLWAVRTQTTTKQREEQVSNLLYAERKITSSGKWTFVVCLAVGLLLFSLFRRQWRRNR